MTAAQTTFPVVLPVVGVRAIEKGRYDPSLPLAFRLATAVGCRIEDLFTPTGVD